MQQSVKFDDIMADIMILLLMESKKIKRKLTSSIWLHNLIKL